MPERELTLRVVSCADQPPDSPIVATVGERGGSIGRATGSLLVLPDPARAISRQHAAIAFRAGRFMLADHGSVVPVYHNGRIVGHGHEVEIAPGDELRIGPYVVHVDDAATEMQHDPEATLILRRSDLEAARPAGATLLSWGTSNAGAHADGIRSVVFPDMPSVDAGPVSQMDTQLPQQTPAPAAPARSGPADASTGLDAAATLPLVGRVPTERGDASPEALLRAFQSGAGLPGLEVPGGLSPAFMRELGQFLGEAVRGILDLLRARATTRREVRADATVIVASDNNPLKFAPGIDAALAALLTPRGPGFLAPRAALEDAFRALTSHQRGFIAGMRAVLDVVLARFDPKALEAGIEEPTVADSLLPLNRKAKLWDALAQLHDELSRESAADLQALFGQEFLRAYQAQVARSGAKQPPE